ncbi:MAG: magnesium transporter, partial [Solirubrobacterales bacterium]|nr:magnesium transporter [Solirubrobacterales bacterium]
DEHQVEFLRERSDTEAAAVLARMESDDAADLLLELDQERRLPVLNLLPAAKQRKIRSLLGYNPSTAGGIMNPDLISAPMNATVADGLERVRASELKPQQASLVCVLDDAGVLAGTVSFVSLIQGEPGERLGDLIDDGNPTPTVNAEADLPEVAQLMADYNLIALPVVDAESKPVGIIAVDDVLELLVPEEWRRRTGSARG